MQWLHYIKQFLLFNHSEKKGILFLLIIILCFSGRVVYLNNLPPKVEQYDYSEFKEEVDLFGGGGT